MSLLDTIENKLLELLNPIIAPIRAAIQLVVKPIQEIKGLAGVIQDCAQLIDEIIAGVKNFQAQPHWKSRVINGPKAFSKLKRLSEIPGEIVNAIKDIFKQLKEASGQAENPAEALEADAEGVEALKTSVSKLGPKIGQVFEKALGIVAIIVQALSQTRKAFDDLKTVLTDLKEIIDDFNKLDGIFLQQNNGRRVIDTDIGKVTIRVGGLHKNG